jgi:hypothetical protein
MGQNNKIKPHWVYVKGKPEEHPEGNFYIHKLDHGRQVWKKIGPNPADAVRAGVEGAPSALSLSCCARHSQIPNA